MQRQFDTQEAIGLTVEIGRGRVRIHAATTDTTTVEVDAGHLAMVSHAPDVVALIKQAVAAQLVAA